MKMSNEFLSSKSGVILVGVIIGCLAALLQKMGNPGNMGVCVACFIRDSVGALGLHRAGVVQYIRPEIIGFVLGSFVAALIFKEFRPRGGSASIVKFLFGVFAMIGALVFLGCPWRAVLRLAGGDGNALFGIAGLVFGIWIGTMFFKQGYSPGRSQKTYSIVGWIMPIMMAGALILALVFPQIEGEGKNGLLFYSVKGPGAMHAPLWVSLGAGLLIGFLAQRSRFCTIGAFRDFFLFKKTNLLFALGGLAAAAFAANMAFGQFNPGFSGQPVAHTQGVWNFMGMVLAGLAFALAGGCPGRQLFLSGEGDGDASIFVLGLAAGAAVAHNFGLASSPKGIGPHGMAAVIIGLVFCLAMGFFMREKV